MTTTQTRAGSEFLTYALTVGMSVMEGRGFYYPTDTVIGKNNRLYVVNRSLEGIDRGVRVTVCDVDSEYYGTFGSYGKDDGQFVWLGSGTIDSQERIFLSDEYLHRVSAFDADGEFLFSWGEHGSGEGQLDGPSGLACDDSDNVYVADSHNNRIQKFTASGIFLSSIGSAGKGKGQLDLPWGVTIAPGGDVYVADWGNDRIQRFKADGEFVASYGESGVGDGQFTRPSSVAVDEQGYVYVADWGNVISAIEVGFDKLVYRGGISWGCVSPNPPKEGVQRGPEETRKCSFASGIMVFERGNLPETRSTQQMLPLEHPDRIQIAFDDHRLVNNAGLLLPATLAQRVGLRELVDRYLDLGHAPGRANAGDKMLTLVASALAGGDCIDDADALRAGRTSSVLGCMVKAPSTLGTFLRSFRWGHVRQLDRVSRELLARAWAAGAGPGDGPLTIDLDSTICETYGLAKEGARHHGYTGKRGYHPLLAVAAGTGDVLMSRLREGRANTARGAAHFLRETVGRVRHAGAKGQLTVRADSGFYTHAVVAVCRKTKVRFSITIRQRASLRNLIEAIPEVDWTPIPYWMDGAADVAEAAYTPFRSKPDAAPVRLIVRRVKPTPGSQLALFASYSYHGFITDRDGDTLELEADHRRHAEVENAIRDLKYGVGLNHLPSGRFAANAAWLAVQVLAHNLARWAARIGLGEQLVTTKTLRRRFFSLAGRLTRSARRLTLHLPQGWPWAEQATLALARLRAIPLPA